MKPSLLLFLLLALWLTVVPAALQAQPVPTTTPAATPGNGTNRLSFPERLKLMHNRPHSFPGAPGAPATPAATATPAGSPPGIANPAGNPAATAAPVTATSSSGLPGSSSSSAAKGDSFPAGTFDLQDASVSDILNMYAKLVNRTLLLGTVPQAKIIFKNQNPLTREEAIEALEAVLALNGVSVVKMGDKFVKVGASEQANTYGAPINTNLADSLPELGSYITRIVQMKYIKPTEILPIIQPFGKLQNSAVAFDATGILVLRDYTENVKRMLELIDQIDISVPTEYTNEVIPIRYAQASDIAAALNSLGGQGGSTVSFGSSSMGTISGLHSSGGFGGGFGGGGFGGGLGGSSFGGGYNGINSGSGLGQRSTAFGGASTPNGTPSGGSSFAQRLNNIVSAAAGGSSPGGAGGKDAIQVFGMAKIIADQRSNALLVFASRQDMVNIKHVINELDVLLAQVLIEAVIVDVNLNKNLDLSFSAAQNPKTGHNYLAGAGGFNNSSGTPFLNLLSNSTNFSNLSTNTSNGIFGNSLSSGGGLQYFGNIGPTWDVAMSALQSDSTANVIQKPRIQTSQAKSASFFVGDTVPYVTGTYYGGGYTGGNSSQYSQLSVGVELDITPFINPDGLVVMDINQEVDDISGYTQIDGNKVPTTTKRTLNSEIAVRNHDTIILGGFVRDQKSKSKSGVPLLMDIPFLGNLFTSRSDSKTREELLVLMRPTVLRSPDEASTQTLNEERRLPGISAAQADQAEYERSLINNQRRLEKQRAKAGRTDGYYNATTTMDPTNSPDLDTNSVSH